MEKGRVEFENEWRSIDSADDLPKSAGTYSFRVKPFLHSTGRIVKKYFNPRHFATSKDLYEFAEQYTAWQEIVIENESDAFLESKTKRLSSAVLITKGAIALQEKVKELEKEKAVLLKDILNMAITETVYRPKCDEEVEVVHLDDILVIFKRYGIEK